MSRGTYAALAVVGIVLSSPLLRAEDVAEKTSNHPPKTVDLGAVKVSVADHDAIQPLALSNAPTADPASVSQVTASDIAGKVTTSAGDLFRGSPGVQVADYGQTGEAQGITMRGWSNGYDGSYVAYYQDGYMRNLSSGISVNGYLDLNPLIPESLSEFTIIRGPFDLRYGGNFAQAGSVVAKTRDYVPSGVKVSVGSYGLRRVLGTYGYANDGETFYTMVDGSRQQGYRANSGARTLKTFTKYANDLAGGRFSAGLETYASDYRQPGYIDLDDIKQGLISKRSAVDRTDHGNTHAYTLTTNYSHGDEKNGWDVSAYVSKYDLERFVTVTPLPQYVRKDKHWTWGGSIDPHWNFLLFGDWDTLVTAGASARRTVARTTELPSVEGEVIDDLNPLDAYYYQRDHFTQDDAASYLSMDVKPFEWMKLTAGLRYDHFSYDVANSSFDAANYAYVRQNFSASTGKITHKLGVSVQPVAGVTVFANHGESPRSPSAVSDLPSNHDLSPALLKSNELGIAYDPIDRFHLQASGYRTTNSNEISIVGSEVVNLGSSKRKGWDLDGRYAFFQDDDVRASLVFNYSDVHARLTGGGGYIPYVAKWIGSYGLRVDASSIGNGNNLRFDLNQTFIGPQKWDQEGATTSKAYSRIEAKVSYEIPQSKVTLWAGAIYYPGDLYSEFGFSIYNRTYVNTVPRLQGQVGVSLEF